MIQPEVIKGVLDPELLAQVDEQTFIPLGRSEILTDCREVEHGHGDAGLAQARRRADHEGALPHLPRREHVAELAAAEGFVQLPVRPPLHIGRGVGAKGASPSSPAAGQRLRISSDNPTLSYAAGLTLLAPYDPERRWRGLTLDEATLSKMDVSLLEAAADLGCSRLQAFWLVTYPLSLSGVGAWRRSRNSRNCSASPTVSSSTARA